jgi:type IV secretion system protein VirB5
MASDFPSEKERKPMTTYRLSGAAAAAALILFAGNAVGQGIPVIDQTAIAKQIESIAQLKAQLDALNQQLQQAQQLYGSLNGVTNMADVAGVLNDPEVRKALPPEFAAIENLLNGTSTDTFSNSASQFLESNSTYRTSADDFYAQELSRIQSQNAGQMTLGQQIYDAATRRIDGIDQLRKQISTASEAKDVADLQTRLQAETAFLQNDVLRMEGLRMVQQAQAQVNDQRKAEDWRMRMDAMKAALP